MTTDPTVLTWRYPWPVVLRCPFDAGCSTTFYVTWADVPDWWPCTCGAEHAKVLKASQT